MATPHIESEDKDIAKIVIMPGDPMRAKYIADNFLDNVKLVNKVRGMLAYTGYFEGKRLTIFPSGMGIPSMGIYAYELFNVYNVDYIIRIGTMGAYDEKLKLGDVILVNRAYSDSSFAKVQSNYLEDYLDSSSYINDKILKIDNELKIGNIYTSDVFYSKRDYKDIKEKYDVLGVEMESFGLFHIAKVSNKKATSLLTVVDSFCFPDKLTSQEREKNLNNMIKIALKTSLNL